ncbi:MAG: hypothetical protein J5486_03980 [Bacteroidaceae bacterium]|nr:hypothetical protein [Bacteroidaceae bacterium]
MINQATDRFINEHVNDDIRQLALTKVPEDVDMLEALTQIEGRQTAIHKLPRWAATEGLRWPRKLSLEQCSSEATADYKHGIVKRLLQSLHQEEMECRLADLTGGLGVDFAALAPLFKKATYVEMMPELCELAHNNFKRLGLCNVDIVCDDALHFLSSLVGCEYSSRYYTLLYIDPARRNTAGRKVAGIEDCHPNVCQLQDAFSKLTRFCLIKLSPMMDITAAVRAMCNVVEVHVVEYKGECKELLLLIDYTCDTPVEPLIYCTDLTAKRTFVFTRTEEAQTLAPMANGLGQYLYEPGAALLKAGAFNLVASRYGLHKIARQTHFYTSDVFVDSFQGRTWQVEDYCSFAKHDIRRMLAGLDRAELSVRGFPMSVAQLRKQLHLKEGGNVHLIATSIGDGEKNTKRVLIKARQ